MNDIAFLELSNGGFAIVDADLFAALNSFRWYSKAGYAARNKPNGRGTYSPCYLAREVANPPKGKFVDHANRNTIDNRRINLRCVNRGQNKQNGSAKAGKQGTKFKGVYPHAGRFRSYIRITEGKAIYLGHFDCPIQAAKAYDAAAQKHFGEFAAINKTLFPKDLQ